MNWNNIRQFLCPSGRRVISSYIQRLYDGDGNLVATTITDENGNYTFLGLLPGNYQVEFVPSSVYDFTTENEDGTGLNGSKNSDANPTTGKTGIIILAAGLEYLSHNANIVTYDPLTSKWIIGELNNVGFATLNITVKVNCEQINSSTFDLGIANNFNLVVIQVEIGKIYVDLVSVKLFIP
ncbi:MAG: SdrD B-like domain-containing protein [Melioribacteraceae bacterium]